MVRHRKQVGTKQVKEIRRSAAHGMQNGLKINVHDVRYGRHARPFDARIQPLDRPEADTKRGELTSVASSEIGVAAQATRLRRWTAKACQDDATRP
ncbi:hypothetical protein ACIO8F_28330 [Streptomyces sp. NPDC087228]|uniref:hypothetical protein n=1 Tax=unclassified Streptomyces TaxID=2593676 RepID=UPI0033F69116